VRRRGLRPPTAVPCQQAGCPQRQASQRRGTPVGWESGRAPSPLPAGREAMGTQPWQDGERGEAQPRVDGLCLAGGDRRAGERPAGKRRCPSLAMQPAPRRGGSACAARAPGTALMPTAVCEAPGHETRGSSQPGQSPRDATMAPAESPSAAAPHPCPVPALPGTGWGAGWHRVAKLCRRALPAAGDGEGGGEG